MNAWRNMLALLVLWFSLHISAVSAMLDISRTADGYILPLSALTSELDPLELVGADSRKDIAFPLSRRLNVTSVELQLVFTNSISLLDISQLAVTLNGSVLAQFPLKSNTPEVTARMVLPLDKLKAGYNRIGFNAAMHYTLDCEDPLHPELWTKIDLERSFISVKANYKNVVDATLADLPDLIDRRLWEEYEITLATVGSVSRETLESGALIAQGAAMFRDYAPLRIKHATLRHGGTTAYLRDFFGDIDWTAVPKGDVIVFGTRDELAGMLGQKISSQLNRPLMAVYPRPDDSTRFVLVISGQNSEDLLRSVKSFALKNVLYPKNFAASPTNNTFPSLGVMEGIGRLKSHVLYRFSDLNFPSTTLEGMGVPSTSLRVWMIPDSFAPRKDSVELNLNMAYGAGFSKQSVLNVIVNGRYESTVPMDEPHGVVYMGYKINIPVSRFKAGWNDVRFEAQMQPTDGGGRCKTIPTKNLQVSIFDESTIRLRSKEGTAFVQNLELIANSGLPFLHYPDGKKVGIFMPQPNSGTMAASWMMMAKLAQLNKAPLYNTRYYLNSMDEASQDNNAVIVVAEQQAIPADLRDEAPLDILRRAREEIRVGHEVSETHRLWGLAAFLPVALREFLGLESTALLVGKDAALQLNADFSRESALVLMPNPDAYGKTVLLVTGATGNRLADDMSALVQFLPWGSLKGDVAVWHANLSLDSMVRTAKITDEHATASASWGQVMGLKISQHPWWSLLWAILSILLFAFVTHLALIRYQRRQHKKRNPS